MYTHVHVCVCSEIRMGLNEDLVISEEGPRRQGMCVCMQMLSLAASSVLFLGKVRG